MPRTAAMSPPGGIRKMLRETGSII